MEGLAEFIDREFSYEEETYPGSKQRRDPAQPPASEPDEDPDAWDARPIVKTRAGQDTEFFTIDALCKALNRPHVTLRLWMRKGYLPEATYRTKKRVVGEKVYAGRRLYTRAQLEAVIAVAEKYGIRQNVRVRWEQLHPAVVTEITDAWQELKNQGR